MGESRNFKPFWTTLAGILTEIAVFITAAGGLIGGLAASVVIGNNELSSIPTPAIAPNFLVSSTLAPTPGTQDILILRRSRSMLSWRAKSLP